MIDDLFYYILNKRQNRSNFASGLGLLDPTVQVDDEVLRVVFIFIQSVAVFKSLYTYIRSCKMVTCWQSYVHYIHTLCSLCSCKEMVASVQQQDWTVRIP